MGDYERRQPGLAGFGPPEDVMIDEDHWLHLSPISTHTVDIRHLPRPLTTIGIEPEIGITTQEREMRDEYIAMCKATYGALWQEMEMFIATTSIDEATELEESAVFDTRLAFDELVQNAFRHGGRPQRLSISLVRATDAFSFVPRQPQPENSNVHLRATYETPVAGNRILLGVQDANPGWIEQEERNDDELPEHLRGLDIIRGISKAVWYQAQAATGERDKPTKWVWTVI